MDNQNSKYVKTEFDLLTYKVNGMAMQAHNELKPGHAEKFYQRRLDALCRENGLASEMEKRVEVWIADKMIGYLILDLWIEECLVVECKAFSHALSVNDAGQVMTYLTATGSQVGMLYNFGRRSLDFKRIFPPKDVQDWQKFLYRVIHAKPGMVLPPLPEPRGKGNKPSAPIPPIRFNVISKATTIVSVPSPSGAAIRASIHRAEQASQAKTDSDEQSLSALSSVSPIRYPLQKSVDKSAYSDSGVSIAAGNRTVDLMKSAVQATYNSSVLAGIGSFGGLYDASKLKEFTHPVLVASTDGVGTKVKLAAAAGRYRGIGYDIVNHCVNDILVQGARPLFFMDYVATAKLVPEVIAEVVTGVAEACQEAGMALLGGETAEMPGVYQLNEFDVAGTIVGVLERDNILPRENLQAGDVLIGLASSGPHTNGYSLIRKIFADAPLDTFFYELNCTLADALLAPHKSYLRLLQSVITHPHLKALAHLTGGGFIENIPRVLPDNLDAEIQLNSWKVPPLWNFIQQKGDVATEEMYQVFNMGIGMILVVDKESVSEIQKRIPEQTFVIGKLVVGKKKTRLLA